jgi:formylmethanofuran dehydrogenase subunit C
LDLTLREEIDGRLRADVIAPDRLAGMTRDSIAALRVWPSRGSGAMARRNGVPLSSLFSVDGDPGPEIRMRGKLESVDGLGTGMRSGHLIIEGNAGCDPGALMAGGHLEITGSAGVRAGAAMSGGRLTIGGSAGDELGGPVPGGSRGMTGGEVIVRGSAGEDAGTLVRRGLIAIGGDVGDGAARSMIAGTVVVLGRATGRVGQWNKRGSIIIVGDATPPPTYRYASTYSPIFLRVLLHHLAACALRLDTRALAGRFARHCGDMAMLGKGELLLWTAS